MRKKAFTLRQLVIRALSYDQLHFLIENNVLSQYLYNIESDTNLYGLSAENWVNKVFRSLDNIDFISEAFTWGITPQGHNYWYELYYKYIEYIKTKCQ